MGDTTSLATFGISGFRGDAETEVCHLCGTMPVGQNRKKLCWNVPKPSWNINHLIFMENTSHKTKALDRSNKMLALLISWDALTTNLSSTNTEVSTLIRSEVSHPMKRLWLGIVHMGKARCCIQQGTQSFIPRGIFTVFDRKNQRVGSGTSGHILSHCPKTWRTWVHLQIFMDVLWYLIPVSFDSFGPPGQWKATGFWRFRLFSKRS